MSLSVRFVDLALENVFRFLTLTEIDNLLKVDSELKSLLETRETIFYQSRSFIIRRKLQEIGISVGSTVLSVAWNPDGQRIVSTTGSMVEGTIHQWDANTGEHIGALLTGHTSYVFCVSYSPDGKRIVSGSDDRTIRQWDTFTGKPIGNPLRGHTYYVRSVAYSPDGTRIVSGSSDKTISQWDAITGKSIGAPLIGHTDWVRSVAYSPILIGRPQGSLGSFHNQRLWNPKGTETGGFGVRQELRIVSGSDDGTIRQWNADTGEQIGKTLCGHRHYVMSVAYSPDGKRIVSGSADTTIRQWNAETGEQIGEPLKGHTNYVRSVAYSPDDRKGLRIVSGSCDKTIRQWDAESGKQIGNPMTGHTCLVMSVAYSPKGTETGGFGDRQGLRIVSGSDDNTIRIWQV